MTRSSAVGGGTIIRHRPHFCRIGCSPNATVRIVIPLTRRKVGVVGFTIPHSPIPQHPPESCGTESPISCYRQSLTSLFRQLELVPALLTLPRPAASLGSLSLGGRRDCSRIKPLFWRPSSPLTIEFLIDPHISLFYPPTLSAIPPAISLRLLHTFCPGSFPNIFHSAPLTALAIINTRRRWPISPIVAHRTCPNTWRT